MARVIRSATLDISERDYVKAVELQGMRPAKVMTSEILPNLISPLMVEAGLRLTYSIVIMAGLAFLGFGQPPPAANWGLMINENRIGLVANPWAVIVPAVLIALLTIGTNTFTDAIARVAIGVDRRPEEAVLLDELIRTVAATGGLRPPPGPGPVPPAADAATAAPGSGWTSGTSRSGSARPAPTSSARSPSRCRAGEVLGLVGESGSGKTTVALALLGHARRGLRISGGEVRLDGTDLLALQPADLRSAARRARSPTSRRTRRPR